MDPVVDWFAQWRGPWHMVVDPQERIFWAYLVVGILLCPIVLGPRKAARALATGLFSRRLWAHPSARADVMWLFVKTLIGGSLVRVSWLALTAGASLEFGLVLHRILGPAPNLGLHPLGVTATYTVVLFVVWDASRFVLHRWLHHSPWLWRFHQVHHSAEVLTPLTLYRVHPVESLLYEVRGLLATGLVTGAFLYLFEGRAQPWQLLGVNAIGLALNALGGNLRHSHVWLRFGPLERWFLSPAQHQLHHARTAEAQNLNYGTWLGVWDRMAGSWCAAPASPPVEYGLSEANHDPHSIVSILFAPLVGRRGR